MANPYPKLSIPAANVPLGVCPHCGKTVSIDKSWYQRLLLIVKQLNQNTADLNP